MLDSFRKRTSNFAFTLLILLIVAVMAMFGIGQLSGPSSGGGGPAAWVNGEMISDSEFKQELQGRLRQYQAILGKQYDEKFILQLRIPQQTLEQLIQYKLLAQQATKMDLLVPNKELANHIRSLPYLQKDGKFDAELYKRLPNRGIEERRQRERLQIIKLQDYINGRVRLSPAELKRSYMLDETKVDLAYAAIDFGKLTAKYRPTAKAINKVLKDTPQAEIQKYYDSHVAQFTEKAKVKLKQIRAGVPFKATADQKSMAKVNIDTVTKEVNAGNFAKMAKKYSDDEYAPKGGNRGWVTRGSLSPALERAVETLQPGQVSGVIETPAGFYVLHVLDKKEQVVQPLDKVKRAIAKELAVQDYRKTFEEDKKKAWNEQLAKGKTIEGELRRLKVTIEKTGPFALGAGNIPKLGVVDSIMEAAFTLERPNTVGRKLFQKGDRYYFIKLRSIQRPKEEEFETKWADVETSVQASIQNELFTGWVSALREKSTIKQEIQFGAQPLPQL